MYVIVHTRRSVMAAQSGDGVEDAVAALHARCGLVFAMLPSLQNDRIRHMLAEVYNIAEWVAYRAEARAAEARATPVLIAPNSHHRHQP